MAKSDYRACWPETVIFWGAGATAQLGLPTTPQVGERLANLAASDQPLATRVEDAFRGEPMVHELGEMLLLLGDSEGEGRDLVEIHERHFPGPFSRDDRIRHIDELCGSYDWGTLSRLICLCPGGSDRKHFKLVDLFNLIDMHLASHHGFHDVPDGEADSFIRPERLLPARNALKMLTCLMMFLAWKQARTTKKKMLNLYLDFTRVLARLMQQEGLGLLQQCFQFDEREFYLFSYAVVSLNWDPILLWLIFRAHKEANDSAGVPHVGSPASPMKLFNDLGYFLGVRQVDSTKPRVWYPCNETATQRLNDREHVTDRRLRIGKFYFPHGSTSFRECPNCGKLMVAFGDDWDVFSETLFPPPLLKCFSEGAAWHNYRRCKQEEDAFGKGRGDQIICPFCATMTESRHVPLIMQSSFKGERPPYLEEIQRDMRVALERAKHIVLLGYSLPADDFVYRAFLSARKNRSSKPYCSILNRAGGAKPGWLAAAQLPESAKKMEVVRRAISLFEEGNVRVCLEGMPQGILSNGAICEDRVRELLYPASHFPDPIATTRRADGVR